MFTPTAFSTLANFKVLVVLAAFSGLNDNSYKTREASYGIIAKSPIEITYPYIVKIVEDGPNSKSPQEVYSRCISLLQKHESKYLKDKLLQIKSKFRALPQYKYLVESSSEISQISWNTESNNYYYEYVKQNYKIVKDHWNAFPEGSPLHWQRITTELWIRAHLGVGLYNKELENKLLVFLQEAQRLERKEMLLKWTEKSVDVALEPLFYGLNKMVDAIIQKDPNQYDYSENMP